MILDELSVVQVWYRRRPRRRPRHKTIAAAVVELLSHAV